MVLESGIKPFPQMIHLVTDFVKSSLVAQMVKNLPVHGRPIFDPWVGKIPWRRECLSIPIFLPGEFHGLKSLMGYSPWGHRVGHD